MDHNLRAIKTDRPFIYQGLATVETGDLFGYIDHSGKIVIPFQFRRGEAVSWCARAGPVT